MKPKIKIVEIDGTEIEREMNDEEYNQYLTDQQYFATKQAEEKTKATQRQALLDKLGITEEEARLLLGGN